METSSDSDPTRENVTENDSLNEEQTLTVEHYLSIMDKLLNDSGITVIERES